MTFDDETLVAFVDGELDDATTAAIEAALERDEALAARVEAFLQTRTALAGALKPLIGEPVPDSLKASVERMVGEYRAGGGNVVSLPGTAPAHARRRWLLPLAASVAVVAAGLGGYVAGLRTAPPARQLAAVSEATLQDALTTRPSGTEASAGDANIRVVSSFRDDQGGLCREFELEAAPAGALISIACRERGRWAVRIAIHAPATDGYTPAGAQETLDAWLASIGAGAPLSPEEERQALAGRN